MLKYNKYLSKLICFVMSFSLLFGNSIVVDAYPSVSNESEKDEIKVVLQGFSTPNVIAASPRKSYTTVKSRKLNFDVPPQIINDRTYVPIRKVVDALGYGVSWDGENQTVILTTVIDTSDYLRNIQHRNMINLLIDLENGGNQSFGRLTQTFNGFTTIDYALKNYSKIKIDIRMNVNSRTSIIKAIPYKRSEGDARGHFMATHISDVSPIIEDGRTLVPLRAASELLGLFIDWNGDTNTVTISGLPIQ